MKRSLIDGRWRGYITRYPGRVLFWYEVSAKVGRPRRRRDAVPAALPTPVDPVPDWAFYLYDGVGYVAHRGKLVATRACPTTDELGRLLLLRDRLNAGAPPAQATCTEAIFHRLTQHTTQRRTIRS